MKRPTLTVAIQFARLVIEAYDKIREVKAC